MIILGGDLTHYTTISQSSMDYGDDIFDVTGKNIFTEKIKNSFYNKRIEIKKKGLFFVRLTYNHKSKISKIMIE